MEKKFINCPKCGTRNFADDIICGVCKVKLNPSAKAQEIPANNKAPQKTNYFVLTVIIAGLIILCYNFFFEGKKTALGNTQSTSTNYQTILPGYTLLKTELNNKRAFNLAVRIEEKLPDHQLKSLAQKIKSDINAVSERGVVFFLLPEMRVDNGAWAAVDFNPEIKVRIIGLSIADEQKIKSGLENITDYIGLWLDNEAQGDVIIRIRKDKLQGHVFEYISSSDPKPSDFATPVERTKTNGNTIFKDTEHPEQFFLLESNGDLSAYDNYGFITTYKKLK